MVLRVFKSFKRSLYPFFLRLIRESASADIIFHKWIVVPLTLVYQKTITNAKTPNLQLTILQGWLIPTAEVWQSPCMTHRFITKQSFIGKRWGRIISLQNTHPIHTPLSFLKPLRNAWNLLPTSSCCRQKENHQLKCALCGSCQCGGVGEAKEENTRTSVWSVCVGVTANILYLLGDTWRSTTLHWTLGNHNHLALEPTTLCTHWGPCPGPQLSVEFGMEFTNVWPSFLYGYTVGYLKGIFISNGRGFPWKVSRETPGGKEGPKGLRIQMICTWYRLLSMHSER